MIASPLRLTDFHRIGSLRLIATFIALTFIAGACDTYITASEEPEAQSFASAEGVRISPMPPGARLGTSNPGEDTSPYGCYLSWYVPDEDVWRYRRVYLHFDEEVVRKSPRHSAGWRYRARSAEETDRLIAFANCIIPQTREAAQMMGKVVGRTSRTASTIVLPQGNSFRFSTTGDADLDGSKANDDGYVCPEGYNWLNAEKQYCQNSDGAISLPVVYVEGDGGGGWGGGDDGSGSDPCLHCGPDPDPCDDPTGLCWDDGSGGGSQFPEPPQDPCMAENPPTYCTNPCQTGDATKDNKAVQIGFDAIWEASNFGDPAAPNPREDRRENGMFIIRNPDGTLRWDKWPNAWETQACGIAMEDDWRDYLPDNLIAVAHTHPWFIGEYYKDVCKDSVTDDYTGGHSDADHDWLLYINAHFNSIEIKSFVIDADSIWTIDFWKNPSHTARCGY
jgi:hypothetical protein